MIEANLSESARKAIEMQPGLEKFFSEAQRRNFLRGVAKGMAMAEAEAVAKAKGKAESLLQFLTLRGLTLTAQQRHRIMGCTDVAMLERWLDRVLSVRSVTELLAAPSREPRSRRARANGRRKLR